MPALQRDAAWAEERLLGDLWQSVTQNGRVHSRSRKNQSSYPAEVRKWNFSPFFSAKDVVKFGVKFWWNFPRYVFQGLGVRRKISPKFHVKNGVQNGKFHANFTLPGRSAEKKARLGPRFWPQNSSEKVVRVPFFAPFPIGNEADKLFTGGTSFCSAHHLH